MGKYVDYSKHVGRVFGKLTVLDATRNGPHGRPAFICLCACGKSHIAKASAVLRGNIASCGCVWNEYARARGRELSSPEARKKRLLSSYDLDVTTGCWIWNGCLRRGGYGGFKMNGKSMTAPRASMLLLRGIDPTGFYVCHTCDNPRCINPDHLFLGTPADNAADRDAKGRTARGRLGPRKRLTKVEAREILSSDQRNIDLARMYGVSERAICDMRRGRTWRQVSSPSPSPEVRE